MAIVGGIQGHYRGKSYAVLYADTQSTYKNGEKGIALKLHTFPQDNYAFGFSGPYLYADTIEYLNSVISNRIHQILGGRNQNKNTVVEISDNASFDIAILLFSQLIGNEPKTSIDPQSIEQLCAQFSVIAGSNAHKPNVENRTRYFFETTLEYLTMSREEFILAIKEEMISRTDKSKFFDLFSKALYFSGKDYPNFIFSFNDDGNVVLNAITSNSRGQYFVYPPVTHFIIGSGSNYISKHDPLAMYRIFNKVEIPLRDAIIHALKILLIAQREDKYSSGLDIVIVKEDGMIPYSGFIDANMHNNPKETLEAILNTHL